MTEDEVVFDETFWQDVYRRARHVRELAAAELVYAEEKCLGEEAEVLPLFTEPFWEGVARRSQRVRALALTDLEAAERKLVDGKPIVRKPVWRMTPQTWARAQGFALALIAALVLLPQVTPVLSWARIGLPEKDPVELDRIADPSTSGGEEEPSEGGEESQAEPDAMPSTAPSEASASAGQTFAPGEDGSAGSASEVVDSSPGEQSGQSGSSSTGAAGVGALSSPDNVVVRAVNPTSIRVSWTDTSGDEVGFEIQREVGESVEADPRSVAKDQTTFLWSGLEAGSTECFRVRAVGGAAPSKWEPDTDRGYACATLPVRPSPSPSPTPAPSPAPSPSTSPSAAPETPPEAP